VAIYLGGNEILEAPQSGDLVKVSNMRWKGYIGAARPSA
jgi:cell wall-associated NlpC family hydrolase